MTNNNIYFIANWKMYGNLNSLNSVKKVIELSKKKKFKNTNIPGYNFKSAEILGKKWLCNFTTI